jgi:hypothetical protein
MIHFYVSLKEKTANLLFKTDLDFFSLYYRLATQMKNPLISAIV